MNTLEICPHRLSDVATSLWEIQKSYFSTVFMLSQKKTNCNEQLQKIEAMFYSDMPLLISRQCFDAVG